MNKTQTTEPRVQAKLGVYVDVIIDGRKQIYDVETAEDLNRQLTQALNLLDQQRIIAEEAEKTAQGHQRLKQDVATLRSADESPLVEGGELRRGA